MKRNDYKTPGKKWLTDEQTKNYIKMFTATDLESVSLGISLFESSPTFKHYKYSPIHIYDLEYRGITTLKSLVYFCKTATSKYDKARFYTKLTNWMIDHTIKYSY